METLFKNLILVGSSQLGKSCFANFLIDGVVDVNNETLEHFFGVGDGINSKTKGIHSKVMKHEVLGLGDTFQIRVIDTPGIGDSNESNTSNMLKLFYLLDEISLKDEEVSCVALIASFEKLLDDNYKRNILFYKKILGKVFQENLVIIITHYECDPLWLKKQKLKGNDPSKIIERIKTTILNELDIKNEESVLCLTVDNLCFDDESDRTNWINSQSTRKQVLDRTCQITGVKAGRLRFPKTDEMIIEDNLEKRNLEGQVNEIDSELGIKRKELETVSKNLENETKKCKKQELALKEVLNSLDVKDSSEPEKIHEISNTEYKSFNVLKLTKSSKFSYKSKFPIESWEVIGSGTVDFNDSHGKDKTTIGGKIRCGVHHVKPKPTIIVLYTERRNMYLHEIKRLRTERRRLEDDISRRKERMNLLAFEQRKCKSDVQDLVQKYDLYCNRIVILGEEYCEVENVKKYKCFMDKEEEEEE